MLKIPFYLSGCIFSRILKMWGGVFLNALKSIVPAVLLAVVMFLNCPLQIYAAGMPSREEAYNAVFKHWTDSDFSNYYMVYDNGFTPGAGYREERNYSFVSADTSEGLFCYDVSPDYNGLDIYFGCYSGGELTERYKKYCYNATYRLDDGSFIYFTSGATDNLCIKNADDGSTKFLSFNTNIPYFSSLDAARSYYDTGDTSGLKNPFALGLTVYDSSVEVPKDLKIEMGAQVKALLGGETLHSGSYGEEDCLFTWKQSAEALEAAEAEGLTYKTEIYYQQTVMSADSHFYNRKYRLSQSELIGTKNVTSVESSYSVSISVFDDILMKRYESGQVPSNFIIQNNSFPVYFYVRNVLGYKHSNWVKVTLNEDGFTQTNISNGYSVVTGGYDEIDGNVNLPGSGSSLKGDSVEGSQYGSNYKIDVGAADTKDFINNLKKGFGLLGDDGLIALLRECFSFIPNEYFVVLVGFISAAAVVGVFKLLF